MERGTTNRVKSRFNMKPSPFQKPTRFIDKVKAAGKALLAGSKAVHGGVDETISTYRMEKKKYRDIQAKKSKKN
jgi:hypothetical protein